MKNIKYIRTIKTAVVLFLLIVSVSACSFNSSISIGNYVSDVNNNVQQAVGVTREFRKITDNLDTRSPDDAQECIKLLDELSEYYTNILKLEAPDRYDDIDTELKTNSKEALNEISKLKSLINTSLDTGDDLLYKHDSQSIIEKYEELYLAVVDLSAQAQTRFRND